MEAAHGRRETGTKLALIRIWLVSLLNVMAICCCLLPVVLHFSFWKVYIGIAASKKRTGIREDIRSDLACARPDSSAVYVDHGLCQAGVKVEVKREQL